MYYKQTSKETFKICADEADPEVTRKLPKGSDVISEKKPKTGIKIDLDGQNGIMILCLLLTSFSLCFVCYICIGKKKPSPPRFKGIKYESLDELGSKKKGFLPLSTDSETDDEVFTAQPN